MKEDTGNLDIRRLFPRGELPPQIYVATLELAAAARDISIAHDLCTVCLAEALGYLIGEALEHGRIEHDGSKAMQ